MRTYALALAPGLALITKDIRLLWRETVIVHELTILSFPPPTTCVAHPGAILLHGLLIIGHGITRLPFLQPPAVCMLYTTI